MEESGQKVKLYLLKFCILQIENGEGAKIWSKHYRWYFFQSVTEYVAY